MNSPRRKAEANEFQLMTSRPAHEIHLCYFSLRLLKLTQVAGITLLCGAYY